MKQRYFFIIDLIVILALLGSDYYVSYLMPHSMETGSEVTTASMNSAVQTVATTTDHTMSDRMSPGHSLSGNHGPGSGKGGGPHSYSDDPQVSYDAIGTVSSGSEVSAQTLAEKFADKFTDTVVQTDSSYTSPDISISVNKYSTGSAVYYVADIYTSDITAFQSYLADGTYGTGFAETELAMDSDTDAILTINGDSYSYDQNTDNGTVIRNGVVYRTAATDSDVCVLYYDGTMKTYSGSDFNAQDAVNNGAYQAWTFGPSLLDDSGNAKTDFNTSSYITGTHPRTAIGYYEPGHYVFVTVDGRQEDSDGMTLEQLSQLFAQLGCKAAYNLDGGHSSFMTFNNAIVNSPSNGNDCTMSDCLLIKEPEN